jgi:hypothetical protein
MDTRQQAKQVICDIIAAGGGRLVGKVRLYKAFYASHLFYWEAHSGTLTNHPIVRMPRGPGIDDGDALIRELVESGSIRTDEGRNGPYREIVFQLVAEHTIRPHDPRFQAVERAVEWIAGKSAAELSEETHLYSRTWRDAQDGEELDIYMDLLDDEDFARIGQAVCEQEELIGAAFAA